MRDLPPVWNRARRKRRSVINHEEMLWEVMRMLFSYSSVPETQPGWHVALRRKRIQQAKEALEKAKAEKDYQTAEFWPRAIKELKSGSLAPIWGRFDYWVESTDEIDTSPEYENSIVRVNDAPHLPDFAHRFFQRRMHPFRHFYVTDGVAHEVVRSHWKGTFKDGKISVQHGGASARLQQMFVVMANKWSNSLRYMMFDEEFRQDMASEIILHLLIAMSKFDPTHGAKPYSYYMSCMNSASYHFLRKEMRYLDIKRNYHREMLTHHPEHGEDLAPPRVVRQIEGDLYDPLWSMGDDEDTERDT